MKAGIRNSIAFRIGALRGALSERIRSANEMLKFTEQLERLADKDEEPGSVEAALGDLETLTGVGVQSKRKRAYHGQETASG